MNSSTTSATFDCWHNEAGSLIYLCARILPASTHALLSESRSSNNLAARIEVIQCLEEWNDADDVDASEQLERSLWWTCSPVWCRRRQTPENATKCEKSPIKRQGHTQTEQWWWLCKRETDRKRVRQVRRLEEEIQQQQKLSRKKNERMERETSIMLLWSSSDENEREIIR